jgi:hypothetical protein
VRGTSKGGYIVRSTIRISTCAIIATALLAVAVGTAAARRFEISEQRFRAVFAPLTIGAEGQTPAICNLTLEGSFHSRTTSKVIGALLGYITAAEMTNCTSETARVLRETLPWHILYVSFTGALPNITSIRIDIRDAAFLVRAFNFISCLYRPESAHPLLLEMLLTVGSANRIRLDESARIPGSGICPEIFLQGTGELFIQSSTSTRITVRLVQ